MKFNFATENFHSCSVFLKDVFKPFRREVFRQLIDFAAKTQTDPLKLKPHVGCKISLSNLSLLQALVFYSCETIG